MGACYSCFSPHVDDHDGASNTTHPHHHDPSILSFFNKCTWLISPVRVCIFSDEAAPVQSTPSNEIAQGTLDADSDSSEECPTCFEEYTEENPKITAECSHQFHLPCIFEWQKISDGCPFCGKVLVMKELVN